MKDKYVLHIPCVKWVDAKYFSVDALGVVDKLSKCLSQYGIDALCYERAIGRYEGREYEQLLVTVFSNDVNVGKLFLDICRASGLQQEAYAYEHNGKMYIC